MPDTTQPIVDFLNRFTAALGVTRDRRRRGDRRTARGCNLAGEEAELLVRHRGEPLKALQHIVDMAFGRTLPDEQRVFVDALEYRKGKDVELRQMAKLLAEKVKQTRRRSAARSAQSLRAPPRAPRGRRSARRRRPKASATRSRRPSSSRYGSRRVAGELGSCSLAQASPHVFHRRHHRRDRDAARPRRHRRRAPERAGRARASRGS